MILTTPYDNGITVVCPGVSRLTADNCAAFKSEVSTLFDEGTSFAVIDFGDVTFLDSSGLGALVGILKKAGMRGEVAVCDLDDATSMSFKLTRMDRVFKIYQDAKSAVQSIRERL